MSQENPRQPIQLRKRVKDEFDKAHSEIAPAASQGEFVLHLIEDYRRNHQKVQV